MAGYKTPEELVALLNEENLMFDAVMSIVGGNNKYGYQVVVIPKEDVHCKKDHVEVKYLEEEDPYLFPNDSLPCEPKLCSFYILKDGDNYWISACNADENNEGLDEEQKRSSIEEYCIAEFLGNKEINTRGKLLKILKDGYQMYKNHVGISDSYEFHRDSLLTAENDIRIPASDV